MNCSFCYLFNNLKEIVKLRSEINDLHKDNSDMNRKANCLEHHIDNIQKNIKKSMKVNYFSNLLFRRI
jgi:hypothetical protein